MPDGAVATNVDIVIDCSDPTTLAEFWSEALDYRRGRSVVSGRRPHMKGLWSAWHTVPGGGVTRSTR
jgi:Glyoxalase-like domain